MEGLRGAFAGQQMRSCRPAARQAQIRVQTSCVATPTRPPASKLAKRSKVEIVKEQSDYLRHPLMEELVNSNSYINEDAVQLMKFHGSYQQDHREKRAFGQGKFYQFMMRTRQPGGTVTNQLYLTMDDLSEQVILLRFAINHWHSQCQYLPLVCLLLAVSLPWLLAHLATLLLTW